jgi:hypothetical protein
MVIYSGIGAQPSSKSSFPSARSSYSPGSGEHQPPDIQIQHIRHHRTLLFLDSVDKIINQRVPVDIHDIPCGGGSPSSPPPTVFTLAGGIYSRNANIEIARLVEPHLELAIHLVLIRPVMIASNKMPHHGILLTNPCRSYGFQKVPKF